MNVLDVLLWRGSILLLPLTISSQMAPSFALETESLLHQEGSLFCRHCINVHCVRIPSVRRACPPVVVIWFSISCFSKHGHRESVVCVVLNSSVSPFDNCGGIVIRKSDLLGNGWVQTSLEVVDQMD